jgi:hypothetical protein
LQNPLHTYKKGIIKSAISLVMAASGSAEEAFSMSTDKNPKLMSKKALDNVNGHFPAGGSCKQLMHFR